MLFAVVFAFSQTDYKMWELTYLKPRAGADMKKAFENMAAHNKKYHAEKPYQATVWTNMTGSHVGDFVWAMGPSTFTDYDSRPNGKDHDEDWKNNVAPYFEVTLSEYWRQDDKIIYMPENASPNSKVIWTVYDLKPGDSYRFKALCEKIVEVYKQKNYPNYFQLYWNQFDNIAGRDVAIETGFDKWSFFDREDNFKKDFEEVHGEGSWWKAIEEYRDVVKASEDEVSEIIPELSGSK